MRLRKPGLVVLLVISVVFAPFASGAQQPAKVYRVGFLTAFSPSDFPSWREGFRQGFRELGYTEGGNIVIEYRYAEGHPERLPALAAELVRLKMDVIAAETTPANLAAQQATATIPIVMTLVSPPLPPVSPSSDGDARDMFSGFVLNKVK